MPLSDRARDNWQSAITFAIWLLGAAVIAWVWGLVKHGPLLLQVFVALLAFFYVLAMLPIHELVKESWARRGRRGPPN